MKAMSTYLNRTGAGDYSLPIMTGAKIVESNRRNLPSFSLHDKTKLSWFAGRDVDFAGGYSPPSTKYSPNPDRPFKSNKYSVGRFGRFHMPSSVTKVHK